MKQLFPCISCNKELPVSCFGENSLQSQEGLSILICRYCQDGKELADKEKQIEGMMREAGI